LRAIVNDAPCGSSALKTCELPCVLRGVGCA
jgi:hypothetical protein